MPHPTVLILASGRGERFTASGGTVHKLKALLAGKAAMSERNFRRIFQQEAGCPPSVFVENARLEGAKQLLETRGDLPLKTVAAKVGLGSEQALRHLFQKRLGITPVAYRERFGD